MTDTALPILDRATFATIEALLPRADLAGSVALLVAACEDLRCRLGREDHGAAAAHMLAGSGGLLGFARLSAAARAYEAGAGALVRALDEALPAMRAL